MLETSSLKLDSFPFLGVEVMKEFMRSNGEDERLFGKVRTKICNERAAVKKRVEARKKELGF